MSTIKLPIPEQNESLERYTVRCAKFAKGVDPEEFNEAVWSMWGQYRGPTDAEKMAARKFSPQRYELDKGICVFSEHETTTAKGEHRKYDLKELAKIVRGNNDRISDVGAFPAISDGHTSNPEDPNQREPPILGYAGNYRLGLIGHKKPRWAVFHDEYQKKEHVKTLREEKPRRSVELWTFKDGRAHFDPIAAIGSEAPRLPLPQRFTQFAYQDATVEKYTFAGNYAAPAAGNTFVQSMGTMKKSPRLEKEFQAQSHRMEKERQTQSDRMEKERQAQSSRMDKAYPQQSDRYAAEPAGKATPTTQPTGENAMPMLAPQDLQQVIHAISQTPQFDFLTKLLEAFKTPDALIEAIQGGGAGLGGDEGLEGGLDQGGDEAMDQGLGIAPEGDDLGDLDALGGGEGEEPEPTPESGGEGPPSEEAPPEEEPEPERRSMNTAGNAVVEKYTQLQRSHNEALKDMATMHSRIQQLERINANHARRAKIAELQNRFPTFIDAAEETERCLYSQKGSMTDAEFEKHIADVERYAEKHAKASVYIPTGDAPKTEEDLGSPEKYAMAQRISSRAIEISTAHRNKIEAARKAGVQPPPDLDYEEAKRIAREELTK